MGRAIHSGAAAAILCAFVFAACVRRPARQSLAVAAAADLQFAMADISREFTRANPGVDLRPTYGSSGNFYAQLSNGAPFDVFLSADVNYPRRLLAGHVGVPDSLFVYGVGHLVVWVPAGSKLDPATALRDPAARHIAIANPEHAPYGRAAQAALRSLGLYDAVREKLVLGENVSQTLGFVETGAADAGIVALSLALAPSRRGAGRYWEVPLSAYPKIEQGGLVMKDSAAARAFRSFLESAPGRAILKRYGFYAPEEQ